MYDELVKRLRNRRICIQRLGTLNDDPLLEEAADAIEELVRRCEQFQYMPPPAWIPVTERLPKDLTRVIVFCEDGVSYGFCEHLIADDEEVLEWCDFLLYPITPTHWMPLPEPPKEEH